MEQTAEKNNVWNAIMYLIIYSVAGFLIETTFGIVTKGVIESRKSFLYGPFCAIYGIGALAMILILRNQKSIGKLFIYGCVIGAFVEYMMSYLCEVFFNVKWWDYSGELLNINGRTCLFYAVSWGILAIVLIKFVNPYVDKFIEFFRQKNNFFKTFAILLIAFYSIDAILTGYTLKVFYYRIVAENNISTENQYQIAIKYGDIKKNNKFASFINSYYNDEIMLKTYPNMMISLKNNNDVYIESLVDGIKPYYYRLGEAFSLE